MLVTRIVAYALAVIGVPLSAWGGVYLVIVATAKGSLGVDIPTVQEVLIEIACLVMIGIGLASIAGCVALLAIARLVENVHPDVLRTR